MLSIRSVEMNHQLCMCCFDGLTWSWPASKHIIVLRKQAADTLPKVSQLFFLSWSAAAPNKGSVLSFDYHCFSFTM